MYVNVTVFFFQKFLERFKKSQVGGRNFANENFLSYRTLVTIGDIKYQFLEFLVDIGFIPINLSGKKRPNYDTIYELTGSQVRLTFFWYILKKVSSLNILEMIM